jgi:hypothetical protein
MSYDAKFPTEILLTKWEAKSYNLKFESKIAVLGGFKPRTAIFLYVLYRPSFKFVKKFFYPWLVL